MPTLDQSDITANERTTGTILDKELDAAVDLVALNSSDPGITYLGRKCTQESNLFRSINLRQPRFKLAISLHANAGSNGF